MIIVCVYLCYQKSPLYYEFKDPLFEDLIHIWLWLFESSFNKQILHTKGTGNTVII